MPPPRAPQWKVRLLRPEIKEPKYWKDWKVRDGKAAALQRRHNYVESKVAHARSDDEPLYFRKAVPREELDDDALLRELEEDTPPGDRSTTTEGDTTTTTTEMRPLGEALHYGPRVERMTHVSGVPFIRAYVSHQGPNSYDSVHRKIDHRQLPGNVFRKVKLREEPDDGELPREHEETTLTAEIKPMASRQETTTTEPRPMAEALYDGPRSDRQPGVPFRTFIAKESPPPLFKIHSYLTGAPLVRAYLSGNLDRPKVVPQHTRRGFITNAFAALPNLSNFGAEPAVQHLTASRTLPYPAAQIYAIIADVDAYAGFLPYCQSSTVTKWSAPDKVEGSGKRWPSEAKLVVGWGGVQEEFTSQVYCVPGRVVEAVSGGSKTDLKRESVEHHFDGAEEQDGAKETVVDEFMSEGTRPAGKASSSPAAASSPPDDQKLLTHLLTRWTVDPFPYKPPPAENTSANSSDQPAPTSAPKTDDISPHNPINPQTPVAHPAKEQTQVSLAIEFAFANPLYSTMSAAVAHKVAGMMIEAFEKRVTSLLEGSGEGDGDGKGKGLGGTGKKVPGEGVMGKGKL